MLKRFLAWVRGDHLPRRPRPPGARGGYQPQPPDDRPPIPIDQLPRPLNDPNDRREGDLDAAVLQALDTAVWYWGLSGASTKGPTEREDYFWAHKVLAQAQQRTKP